MSPCITRNLGSVYKGGKDVSYWANKMNLNVWHFSVGAFGMSSPFEVGAKWLRENILQTDLSWKNCEIVGLFNSSNLQVTIFRVNIFVFKGRPRLSQSSSISGSGSWPQLSLSRSLLPQKT